MAQRAGLSILILALSVLIGTLSYAGVAFCLSLSGFLIWQRVRPWMEISTPQRFSEIGRLNSRWSHTRVAIISAIFASVLGAATFSIPASGIASLLASIGGQFLATSLIIGMAVLRSHKEKSL